MKRDLLSVLPGEQLMIVVGKRQVNLAQAVLAITFHCNFTEIENTLNLVKKN
jgi:hypothetical protein